MKVLAEHDVVPVGIDDLVVVAVDEQVLGAVLD